MAQTKAQLFAPLSGQLNLSGIITSSGLKVGSGVSIVGDGVKATAFYGDGSSLAGIVTGTTLSAGSGDQRVVVTSLTSGTMTSAATDAELTYNSGTNTLSATTFSGALTGNVTGDASGSSGSCSGNSATATVATNAQGLTGTPDITVGNLTGVAATFTGVLTYEDVTNVDSVGVITARSGIKFGLAGVGGTITADGHAEFVGVCTASSFDGGSGDFTGIVTATSFDGRVPQIPQNLQAGTYTLVNSDAGKHINAGGNVTVNSGIFAIGDAISVFNDTGGDITIIQGSSVTLRLVADTSTGTRTLANYGLACILCVGSNEFVVSGGGIT